MLQSKLTKIISAVVCTTVVVFGTESSQQKASIANADAYRHIPVNVSFVPNVGTGGFAGNKAESNLSLNVIGGAIGSLKGAEFGGVVNIEKDNMSGAQFSGVVNVVGNDVTGVQFAGVTNVGTQSTKGLQIGGVNNITGSNSSVCQLSGVSNVAGNSNGVQISGVSNVALDYKGVQISGVANVAKKVTGVQIGLINIADDIDGVPIGLFSYVRSVGLHYQVYVNEVGHVTTAIRNGGEYCYSLLMFGVQPYDQKALGTFGFGIGGRLPIKEKYFLTSDITTEMLFTRDVLDEDLRFITRFRVGGGWQIQPRLALIGGFSLNTYHSKEDAGEMFPEFIPEGEKKKDGLWRRTWPGAYVGLEF